MASEGDHARVTLKDTEASVLGSTMIGEIAQGGSCQ